MYNGRLMAQQPSAVEAERMLRIRHVVQLKRVSK